jgi:hypothetical protein
MASRHRGVEMPELCARLARAAIARGGRSRPAVPHAPSAAQHAPFAASPSTSHATSQAGS